jgi:hypothetical protein
VMEAYRRCTRRDPPSGSERKYPSQRLAWAIVATHGFPGTARKSSGSVGQRRTFLWRVVSTKLTLNQHPKKRVLESGG